jgi:cyclopropane-fatty-acyl-phospholipid synthase
VTSVTISQQQFDLAARRLQAAGVSDRVELLLCDYRDLSGRYDKLVSIEMIEAVGHRHLPRFFAKCAELLRPDGQMLLQAISMPDQRYDQYLKNRDFIQRYVFPGSCCPALSAMLGAIKSASDMKLVHLEDIGPHYARTLKLWREKFKANEDKVLALGYPARFVRMWEYYLSYCEAGFEERYLSNVQMLLARPESRAKPILATLT